MPCVPIKNRETVDDMMEALAMRPNGFVYALYFEFALTTALRVSDILSLRKSSIKDGIVYVKTQKTGEPKVLALNDKCRRKMEAYLETKKDDDYIFPWKRQWVHKLMKYAADQVGIDKELVSCHTTRKTAAYHFYIHSGYDIMKTAQFLGHKSSTETRKYLAIGEEEVNEINLQISWS